MARLPGYRLRDQPTETFEVENSVQLLSEAGRAGS
jgi:hypothetical protein